MQDKTNVEKAIAVLQSLQSGDRKAIEEHISPQRYTQHNLAFPDGREALLGALEMLKKDGTRVKVLRYFSDGHFVFTHVEYFLFCKPQIGFDIFHFKDGQIVEHWDNLQDEVDHTPSGHTMIDGARGVRDVASTRANKDLVKEFVQKVLIEGDLTKLPSYFAGDRYIQHNPWVKDGLSGLGEALKQMADEGNAMKYTKAHMLMGEGNYVLVVSEGYMGAKHSSFYDLFRLEKGKIVEHWDTIETIPPKDQWKNKNGKF